MSNIKNLIINIKDDYIDSIKDTKKKIFKIKTISNIFTALFMLIISFATFIYGSKLLNYLVIPPYNNELHYIMMKAKEINGDIDVAVFGASAGLTLIDTKLLSETTDYHWYNTARSSMTSVESEFYVKAIFKYHNPKYIFFEVDASRLYDSNYFDRNYIDTEISEDINPELLKTIMSTTDKKKAFSDAFPWTKYIKKIFDYDYVKNNISIKKDLRNDQRIMSILNDYGLVEQDYIASQEPCTLEQLQSYYYDFIESNVNNLQLNAIKRSIDFVNSKGSQIILFSPVKAYYLNKNIPARQRLNNFLNALAEENECTYIDFSLIKREFFNRQPEDGSDQLFYDSTHMTKNGSRLFTEKLAIFFEQVLINGVDKNEFLLANADELIADYENF